MLVTIFKYRNRKLYIPAVMNKGISLAVSRYVTLKDIAKIISNNKYLFIRVIDQKTQKDITKQTLFNILNAELFTLENLYNFVREQAQLKFELDNLLLETIAYKNGIEL